MKIHDICALYPDMQDDEFEALKASIKTMGLQHPIVLLDEEILDGKNRFKACKELGIMPSFVNYDGNKPIQYVAAQHNRRNLTPSQRALIAVKISNFEHGGDRSKGSRDTLKKISMKEAADLQGVSESSVKRAKQVIKEKPELIPDIEAGKTTVGTVSETIITAKKIKAMAAQGQELAAVEDRAKKRAQKYQKDGETGKLSAKEQAIFDKQLSEASIAEKLQATQTSAAIQKERHADLLKHAKTALFMASNNLNILIEAKAIFDSEVKQIIREQTTEIIKIQTRMAIICGSNEKNKEEAA